MNDIPTMKEEPITTTELARRFGVKVNTVNSYYYTHGHYKGYEHVGAQPRATVGRKEILWQYNRL